MVKDGLFSVPKNDHESFCLLSAFSVPGTLLGIISMNTHNGPVNKPAGTERLPRVT